MRPILLLGCFLAMIVMSVSCTEQNAIARMDPVAPTYRVDVWSYSNDLEAAVAGVSPMFPFYIEHIDPVAISAPKRMVLYIRASPGQITAILRQLNQSGANASAQKL